MSIWHIVMLSAGAVAASTIGSQAGPCSAEIYSMEARVEATLKAKAADGPTLQVSREALLHRQPTPGSIAAAESKARHRIATDDRCNYAGSGARTRSRPHR